MTDQDLARLLAATVDDAETSSPAGDPIAALVTRRRRQEQRRGHLAALAFVVFVLVLQLSPAEALGSDRPAGSTVVAAAEGTSAVGAGRRGR